MDINDFRGLLTAVIFLAFLGISVWAFSRRTDGQFEDASRIPLQENQRETIDD